MSRVWGTIVFFAAAMLVGAIPLWPVYQSPRLIVLVLGALIGGALIALAGLRYRWPGFVVLLATVGFWLVFGAALALPAQAVGGVLPTPASTLELVRASVLGWKQLVTISLPVGTYQSLLVPALVLILVATVVGLSVALRSRRPAWGFSLPAVVMIVGIAIGDTRTFLPFVSGLGLIAITLGWYLWRLRVRGSDSLRRFIGGSLVVMLSAGAAIVVTGVALPAAESRSVVRELVVQPFDAQNYPSPLSGYRAYLQPEISAEVLLEVSGLPANARLSLARLSSYDGVVAGLGASVFSRVPSTILQTGSAGTPVELRVQVDAYRGVWVPGVGPLESIEFTGGRSSVNSDGFFYDRVSDTMAVTTGGLGRGDAYRLNAVLPRMVPLAAVAGLVPGPGPVPEPVGVPSELRDFVLAAAPANATPGARLAASLSALATSGYVSHGIGAAEPFSRSGHGADRLTQLFTAVPMLGDSEQYAVAAALMADSLGFPARVVVGFAPGPVSGDSTPVRGSDIAAWVEVLTSDSGWVGIDPTPPIRPVPDAVPEEAAAPASPPVILPPLAEAAPDAAATVPLANQDDQPVQPADGLWGMVGAILGITGLSLAVLAVLFGPFVAVVVAKSRRRTRRRSLNDGRDRARAAWQEFLDASADGGQAPLRSGTRLETAERIGGSALLVFATGCDRASYSPLDPSEVDVDRLWSESDSLRESLLDALRPAERLRARVSPLTLPAYHYWQRFWQRIRNTSNARPRRLNSGSGPRAADGRGGAARE